jgi:succinate dehydrogenase hydrophobic anchor subunit
MLGNILKMFNQGFLHWFTQRTSACLLIVSVVCVSIFDSLFLAFIVMLIVVIHFESGIHTLVSDYMHDPKSKLVSNLSIDLLIIYLAKTVFIILVCV